MKINKGYKDSYLTFIGKLTQNCTYCILDDYNFYKKHDNKHGKLLLVDPYDIDTLQIFFDVDLHKNPEKRIKSEEALKHPFLTTGINFSNLLKGIYAENSKLLKKI